MKLKTALKISVDVLMTVLYFFLLAYKATDAKAHEILGVALFFLFIAHNFLNLKWYAVIFRGRYTAFRVMQTAVNLLLLISMLCLVLSGVLISRDVFAFLDIGYRFGGRELHMMSAYWGFILMSVHIGLHWGMVLGAARKIGGNADKKTISALRLAAFSIALYGIYAFCIRDIASKIFLIYSFSFWDYEEFVGWFFLDCMSIMGLFICAAHYVSLRLPKK